LQLTFFMVLKNPLFFNYTSLPAANNNGNIYYFSNRNNNPGGTYRFLTGSLLPYNSANTYSYEDLIVDAGTTYQSVSNNSTSGLGTNNWRNLGADRFMSAADQLRWMPPISSLASATPTNIEVKDEKGNIVLAQIIQPSFPLDISGLIPGKYFLTIGVNPEISIYVNQELANTQVFGVIDILIENTLPAGYEILKTADNSLLSPAYSVYFLNRATIWKYTLMRQTNATITDTGIYVFTTTLPPATPTTVIQSQFPIPLSEIPITTLKLDTQSVGPPCATANRLSKDPNDTSATPVCFSDIFLNY
jgi:hypothetical protein